MSEEYKELLHQVLTYHPYNSFKKVGDNDYREQGKNPYLKISSFGLYDFKTGAPIKNLVDVARELNIDLNNSKKVKKMDTDRVIGILKESIENNNIVKLYYKTRGLELSDELIKDIGFKVNSYKGKTEIINPIKKIDGTITAINRVEIDDNGNKIGKKRLGTNKDAITAFGNRKSKSIYCFEGLEDAITYCTQIDPNGMYLVSYGATSFKSLNPFIEKIKNKTIVVFLDPDSNGASIKGSSKIKGKVVRLIPEVYDCNSAHKNGLLKDWQDGLRKVAEDELPEDETESKIKSDVLDLDGLLNDEQVKRRLIAGSLIAEKENGLIFSPPGCINGDETLIVNRGGGSRTMKLRDLWVRFNSEPYNSRQSNAPYKVRSMKKDGRIGLHSIYNVKFTGFKPTLAINAGRRTLRCTHDHKIFTDKGWVPAERLIVGVHKIAMDKSIKATSLKKECNKIRYKESCVDIKYPAGAIRKKTENYSYKRRATHILIYEAFDNGYDSLGEYLKAIKDGKSVRVVDSKKYHVHHIDENPQNNKIENLKKLTIKEHRLLHSKNDKYNFNQGMVTYHDIKSIKDGGVRDVYDIYCDEPYHNFVASEMIVHNCGKSWLAMRLAFDASAGNKFLKWQFVRPLKTLYVDGENGVDGVKEKYEILKSSLDNFNSNNLKLLIKQKGEPNYNISDLKYQEFIEERLTKFDIEFLVLDNLSCLADVIDSKDNNFDVWRRTEEWLRKLNKRGITTILIHHTNKGGKEQSGDTRKERFVEFSLSITEPGFDITYEGLHKEGHHCCLEFVKHRYISGDEKKKLYTKLTGVGTSSKFSWCDYEEILRQEIAKLEGFKTPKQAIVKQLQISESLYHKLSNKHNSEAGSEEIPMPESFHDRYDDEFF